ncbi:MAG: dynamin family protein [Treponemataceae bacterium]|nr:dynamin family protein [Treponemataceae bacterium]
MATFDVFYSPITKDYKFKKNGKSADFEIESWQKLRNTYQKDGVNKFLQEVNNSFFDAIYKICYGTLNGEIVDINIQTTKDVYEDFKNMIENYNNKIGKSERNIRLGNLIEMESNENVRNHIYKRTSDIKELLENFDLNDFDFSVINIINTHIEKIKCMLNEDSSENAISLCVTGVYSTGKSTFINALIGENLLESEDEPTTASVFTITKVTQNDPIKISFNIESPELEEIQLIFKDGIFKSEKEICNQEISNELIPLLSSSKSCIEQIHSITKYINEKIKKYSDFLDLNDNKKEDTGIEYKDIVITTNVDIYYPFEIGGEIPVKICDTPGSNSSFRGDKRIIEETLADQKNSILITLLSPDKSDDAAGHDILFNIFDKAEKENTCIDKSRLFFIWNKIDGTNCRIEKIETKKKAVIKVKDVNQNIKIIRLDEYPQFFMSSSKALLAKKLLKNQDDEILKDDYEDTKVRLNLSEECLYGWQTEEFKSSSQNELIKVEGLEYNETIIRSGLYSVEKGINDYINKYAGAILSNGLYEKIKEINEDLVREIESEKEKQEKAVKGESEKFDKKKQELLSLITDTKCQVKKDIRQKYQSQKLDEYNEAIIKKIDELYGKKYKHSAWKGEKSISEFHLKTNTNILNNLVSSDLNKFVSAIYKKTNEDIEKEKEEIFNKITENLSKEFSNGIGLNNWERIKKIVLTNLKNDKQEKMQPKTNEFFFWSKSKDFKIDAKNFVIENTVSIQDTIKDFYKSMESIIEGITNNYKDNLEEYSESLVKIQNDKEKEEEKYRQIQKLSDKITEIVCEIDKKIKPND